MQSKTNNSPTHISLAVGASSMAALGATVAMPNTALGLTLDDVSKTITSSPVPLACAGVGFVVGAGCMAAVAHAKHKREIQHFEERLGELEEQLGKADAVIEASREDRVSKSGIWQRISQKDAAGGLDKDAQSAAVKPVPRHAKPEASNKSIPVIVRGDTGNLDPESTARIDLAHFNEVARHLDGKTRAKMIERRIPKLISLIETSDLAEALKEDTFYDPKNFDPSTYVDRLMREELQRRASNVARIDSLPQLTVIEGKSMPAGSSGQIPSLSKEA